MAKLAPVIIFGYGSLMDNESLRATVPTAKNLKPAYIKGFRREFNKIDEEGWHSTNLDLAGIPYCAVNVAKDENNRQVNGITFEVELTYFDALKQREKDYEPVETTACDFETGKPLGECFVFLANTCDGSYEHGNPAQERYLKVCLSAAKEYGDDFYKQFLATTYIGGKSLDKVPGLIK